MIHYSRGASKLDAYPKQRTAENWEDFAAAVLKDQSKEKGLQYIAAPFKPNGDGRAHRCQEGALPSAFVGFDFDGFSSPVEFSETVQHLQRYKGFAYTTASNTPDAPRARALLSATREMDWTERKRVSLGLQTELEKAVGPGCIKFDQSVYQAEQPMYCPPVGTKPYMFDGAPVDVDKVLETAPPLPDRKGKRERAEAIATDDPVLQALQEKEMVLQELEAGKFAVVCPFEQEHTDATSATATVYYLPHFAGVRYGKFHCLHEHCTDRDQPAFLQALGLEPRKVWAEQRGEPAQEAPQNAQDWPEPEPLPAGLPDADPFDYDLLPAALRGWVQDIAERVQCPPDFVGVPIMAAAGAVLGRKVGIRPQQHTDWTEVANQWALVVGRPGVLKSPAMEAALAPLKRLEAQALSEHQGAAKDYDQERKVAKLRQEVAEKEARGKLAKDRHADVSALFDMEEPEEPTLRRYKVNDTTAAALGEVLRMNPNGVLVHRDEMVSLLRSLDREDQAEARGFYLTAWNGDSGFTFDRIGRGLNLHIPAVCLSMLGGTQPARLAQYVRTAVDGGAGDDGLIQRFGMLVWPETGGTWKEVDRWPNSEAKNRAFQAFQRLDQLTPADVGAQQDTDFEGNPDGIPFLRFSEDALGLFREWRHDLEAKLRSGNLHPALEAHLAKYRKLAPGLALAIHLTEAQGPVSEHATLRALAWTEYLESHARRAYGAVNNADVTAAQAILHHIRNGDLPAEFSSRDVWRPQWAKLTDNATVHAGLRLLTDFKWLGVRKEETPGRTATVYMVNPRGLQK